jgi:type I restriction enzyme S subunit
MMPNNDLPERFKETEIGPIPVEWEVVRLGGLARVNYGKAKPTSEGLIPVVGSGGIYGWADEALIDFPTLVIGRKGTAGRAWLMEEPCWPSDTTFYLEWTKEVDIRFLFGYLTLKPLSGEHAKTTLPSLSRPDLENYPIPLPPLPEQRRIAHVLSTIQRAIAAQDDLIIAAREVKRSLMQRLFTYGPGPEPAPTQETEIGEVPEHWDAVALEEVADLEYGVQAAVAHLTDDAVGIPILTNVNITLEGDLDLSTLRYYELPEKWKHKQLQKGDVLFNWRSGSEHHVGKTAIFNLTGEYTFSSFILRFRSTSDALRPEYLAKYLHHLKASGFFMRMRQQSSVNKVFNKSESARITVPLPSPSEQQEITLPIAAAESKIAAEEQRRAALQALFKAMLHQLMTGQVRVKEVDL